MNKTLSFLHPTICAILVAYSVSFMGCGRSTSAKSTVDGSVPEKSAPAKRSLAGNWVSHDDQYQLVVREDGSALSGYKDGVMTTLSWTKSKVSDSIILDYDDVKARFSFRGDNDPNETILSSSKGSFLYTRQIEQSDTIESASSVLATSEPSSSAVTENPVPAPRRSVETPYKAAERFAARYGQVMQSSRISNGAYDGWNFSADRNVIIVQVEVFPTGGNQGESVLVAVGKNDEGEWAVIKSEIH